MLELFIKLLSKADVVIASTSPLLSSWDQDDVTGDPQNEVLRLSWESEGEIYSTIFTEEGISNATYDKETDEFSLLDSEGDRVGLKLCQLVALRPD